MQFEKTLPNTLLDVEVFLSVLATAARSGKWTARIENYHIGMTFVGRPTVRHSPLTAVVYALTEREVYDADFAVMLFQVHDAVCIANFLLLQLIDAERGTEGHSWNVAPLRQKILEAIKPCLAVSE